MLKHPNQASAALSCLDHIGINVGKNERMARQGHREGAAAAQILHDNLNGLFHTPIRRLALQVLEGLKNRNAGSYGCGQMHCEIDDLPSLDRSAEERRGRSLLRLRIDQVEIHLAES